MYDQNQNIQPDYSFITNQPGPAPKKTPKPLYVFAGVIGVFLLLIGFIFVSSRNNVKKVADGPKFDSAAQVPEQYLRHVGDNQYPEAFKLFTTESQNLMTEEVYLQQVPASLANVELSQCTLDNTAATDTSKFTYNCLTKKDKTRFALVFDVRQQDDTFRIQRYDFVPIAEEATDEAQS